MLQKYVYRELTLTFLLCFAVFAGVIFLGLGLRELHFYKDLGLEFLLLALPNFAPFVLCYTLPIALLTACTFTYGRMAGDRELDAIRSCGVSLGALVWPAILMGLISSLASLELYQDLMPTSRYNTRRLTRSALQRLVSAPSWGFRQLKVGTSHLHFQSVENGEFRKIVLVRFDGENIAEILLAERCRFTMDNEQGILVAELTDCAGERRQSVNGELRIESGFFGKVIRPIQIDSSYNKPKTIAEMNIMDLETLLGVPFVTRFKPYDLLCEYHRRFAMAFAPLVFSLIGSALGIALRRGSKLAGLGVTTLPVLLVYYPLIEVGNALGAKGVIPPIFAMWIPNLSLTVVAMIVMFFALRR